MASWRFPGKNSITKRLNAPVAKAADYTLTPDDNGVTFIATAAVTFTLPTVLQAGYQARFVNGANSNMGVAAPSGKLVAFNNAAATSIAFSTASEKAGNALDIICDGTSYYALVMLGAETATPTIA